VIVAPLRAVADAWPTGMVVAIALFGLAIGSFLNVVIARVPAGRSLVRPGSACPGCSALLKWYDNIPVLSFLVLRGRCRACRMTISWRYPIVEMITAVVLVFACVALGPTADFAFAVVLLPALIAITGIDLAHQLIPDAITLPGILVGLLLILATGRIS